jgi:hypothetical protein
MLWCLEAEDVGARETPSREMSAHHIPERRPDRNNSVYRLIVLGFGSEDIGVVHPLKRIMVVSKIHLTTKLTYQNMRHHSQGHCTVSPSLRVYEYIPSTVSTDFASDRSRGDGRQAHFGCIGNGPLGSCTKPDDNTTNLEHRYTQKTSGIHVYVRSLCPPLSVSLHSEFTFTTATPPANHKPHST